jgi:alpha-glucosidase
MLDDQKTGAGAAQDAVDATARDAGQAWWRGATLYQIYPRSFADSDGDGTGDLSGIIARLDHVASLGVDAIWVSPFFRSPMADFGYDVSDYREVDPIFGTLADFDRLVSEAHRRGLRVIIDQVMSHTSDQHRWFQESRQSRDNPRADWYVWADPAPDGTPPNNWLSIFGGPAWQWEPRRGQYYLHNFLVSQPDLNYHNPAVAAQMLEECEFWLQRGVDGFRLDAINFCFHDPLLRSNPPKPPELRKGRGFSVDNPYAAQVHLYDNTRPEMLGFLERLRAVIDRYPQTMTLGEIASEDAIATVGEYTAGDARLHSAYCFELLVERFSTAHVREVIESLERRSPGYWPTWAIGNHDVARVASRWACAGVPTAARAKLLNAFLLSLKGTTCTYQGEELGLTEAELPREALKDPYGIAFWPNFKGRDGCRTPMPWSHEAPQGGFTAGAPWLPMPAEHRAQAVSRQAADPASTLNAFRTFVRFRRGQSALRLGSMRFLDAPDGALCFLREHEGRTLLAAFNFGAAPVTVMLPAGAAVTPLIGHGFDPCMPAGGRVTLPAAGAFFAHLAPGGSTRS